jgi:hypothetical protein
MAIQFKVVERGQPEIKGGVVKKFYASPVQDREMTLEGLTQAIECKSTLSNTDFVQYCMSWCAMVEQATDGLSEGGRIIRLGDLGSCITLSSESRNSAEKK